MKSTVVSKSDAAILTTNRFTVVFMLTFLATTAMMRELPMMETAKIKAIMAVVRSVYSELNVTLVSFVAFKGAISCCYKICRVSARVGNGANLTVLLSFSMSYFGQIDVR